MIEPVSSLTAAPSAAIEAPAAPPPDGVETASGPLPQPDPAQVEQFGVRAAGIEEVPMQARTPGVRAWSDMVASVKSAADRISTMEAKVDRSLRRYQEPSEADLAGPRGRLVTGVGPDGSGAARPAGGSRNEIDLLMKMTGEAMAGGQAMIQFSMVTQVVAQGVGHVVSATRQLSSGGGGG